MIDSSTDRIDYSDLITAPPCYELDFALGTTYSLDLKALLGVYASLGLNIATDSSCQDDPMHLFAAISSMRGKVLVMCEKGRLRAPTAYNSMFSQVANGIVQVDLPTMGDTYPSFHPKLWILRLVHRQDPGSVRYRIVVMSRNLTFDSSWDVAGSFEGNLRRAGDRKRVSDGGIALYRALRRLRDCISESEDSKAFGGKLDQMAEEIKYVHFKASSAGWKLEKPFNFTNMSYGRTGSNFVGFREAFEGHLEKARRVLVMTPFLSPGPSSPTAKIVDAVAEGRIMQGGAILVTRRDALAARDYRSILERLSVYAVKDYLVSAPIDEEDAPETQAEDDDAQLPSRDIHAKIFAFEEEGVRGRHTHLFFGSANATYRGLNVNYEAMAHLSSSSPDAFDSLLDDLGIGGASGDDETIFERIPPGEEVPAPDLGADTLARAETDFAHFLRRVKATLNVIGAGKGLYDVEISFALQDGERLPIEPTHVKLLGAAENPFDKKVRYPGIELKDLSEFVKISYRSGDLKLSGVLKCTPRNSTTRSILDQRRAALFRSVCASDGNQLIDYLSFRLSKNPELEASIRERYGRADSASALSLPLEGLYENLVGAFVGDWEEAQEVVSECLDLLAQQDGEGEAIPDEDITSLRHLLEAFNEGGNNAR